MTHADAYLAHLAAKHQAEAVDMRRDGKSLATIARKLNLDVDTVRKIIKSR